MSPRTLLAEVLRVAWRSPVDHPREALLIFSARMAVLWGTATVVVLIALILAVLR